MKTQSTTYNLIPRLLHWINALLILILLLSAEAAEGRGLGYQFHIVLGSLSLIFTIAQIGWYLFGPKPTALQGLSPLRKIAFDWNHHLILLAALFATVTGAIIVWGGGGALGDLHEAASASIVILLLMHVAGVLYYQFFKGNTLGRMAPTLFGRIGKN